MPGGRKRSRLRSPQARGHPEGIEGRWKPPLASLPMRCMGHAASSHVTGHRPVPNDRFRLRVPAVTGRKSSGIWGMQHQ